jgi:cyclic-di-AMP phosphodiesterase PgpH
MKEKKKFEYSNTGQNDKFIRDVMIKTVLIIFAAAGIAYLYNTKNLGKSDNFEASIQAGKEWNNNDLKADFNFAVPKSKVELDKERSKIREETPPYFVKKNISTDTLSTILRKLSSEIPKVTRKNKSKPVDVSELNISEDLKAILYDNEYTPGAMKDMVGEIEKFLLPYIDQILKAGYIDIALENLEYKVFVTSDDSGEEFYRKKNGVFDKEKARKQYTENVTRKIKKDYTPLADYFLETFATPNLIYDEALSNDAVKRHLDNIVHTKTIINKNQLIVAKGEIIDADKSVILARYFNLRSMKQEGASTIWDNLGTVGHGLILLLIIILYVGILRKDIWVDNFKVFLVLAISVITVSLAWMTGRFSPDFPLEYLIVLPGMILVIAILIDVRAAVIIALVNALMIAGIRNNDYIIGTTYLIASGITAYSVRKISTLAQTFSSIIVILVGFTIPIVFFGFETHADTEFILRRVGVSAINAIASPVLAFIVLFIMDKIGLLWHFDTNLDLRKYDNKDHKLIRMLRENAPGTYQHTLSVANLAETCASEIGANSDLVRIGAYFHDIGKAVKPEYFTENQNVAIGNKHDKLSPKQSALLIKGHVLKGEMLAKEYNLPKKIAQFIPMHHGTSLIKHFYAKALEENYKVDTSFFRYHGPKPQNKEAAILMICDVSEAISRISDATLEEIEEKIDANIQEKVIDGQLNESGITLGELEKIKQTIAEVIHGMIHRRTAYKAVPEKNSDKKKK